MVSSFRAKSKKPPTILSCKLTTVVNTTQCKACFRSAFGDCLAQEADNCTNPTTDSCFSATGCYMFNNSSKAILSFVARGCIACPSEKLFLLIEISVDRLLFIFSFSISEFNFKVRFETETNWTLRDYYNIMCFQSQGQ
nr:uncharacterized protein LOC131781059 [Pocillopora verrucosa]